MAVSSALIFIWSLMERLISACCTFSHACWRMSWKFGGAVVKVGGSDRRRFCMVVVCA